MSILVGSEEFDMGLAICHDRLVDAVKAYEEYLVCFGTVPDMSLAMRMKVLVDKVLAHDRMEGEHEVTPFRRGAISEGECEFCSAIISCCTCKKGKKARGDSE